MGDTQVEKTLAEVVELRTLAEAYERKATDRLKALAQSLVTADTPLRDIGEILGISHQRVHQIVKS